MADLEAPVGLREWRFEKRQLIPMGLHFGLEEVLYEMPFLEMSKRKLSPDPIE